ncbi:SMP-30/gluconolactonase/LRE family protein [Fontivita pretiosa]|uniref:SMP-30/gluconolactonase/LRE family protein n=1 Tax=Fontivita pretiosa TaxID=2989684 RepID=UPI003D16DE2B
MEQPQVVVNEHCQVGEGPLWDERRGLVYWTDIDGGKLFCWDIATRTHRQIYNGEPVGGFTLQEDGSLLLFRANNIALLGEDGSTAVIIDNIDPQMVRFNDVIADPEGRVFAGTIGEKLSGGLYRVDLDGRVTLLERGTDCANGMDFSPDLSRFYWTDTSANSIFCYDYDRGSGRISNKRTVVRVPQGQGVADGLAVDTEGNLWSARWGGFGVWKHSPDGREIGRVALPVQKVSSVIFGGKDLDTLFITTAAEGLPTTPDSLDGALFCVRVAARGRPSFRSRIMMRRGQ